MEVEALGGCVRIDLHGTRFLVDGVLTTSEPPTLSAAAADVSSVDVVLLCHARTALALPAALAHPSFRGRLLATEPVVATLRAAWHDELHAHGCVRPIDEAALRAEPEVDSAARRSEISACLARLTTVVYGQVVEVGATSVCAYSAGATLGAANWVLHARGDYRVALLGSVTDLGGLPRVHALSSQPGALAAADVLVLPIVLSDQSAHGSALKRMAALVSAALDDSAGAGDGQGSAAESGGGTAPRPPHAGAPPQQPRALRCACAGEPRAPGGSDVLVTLSLEDGALVDAVEVLDAVLRARAGRGQRAPPLVLVSSGASAALAFAQAAAEWAAPERQPRGFAPSPVFPFAEMQRHGRLHVVRHWAEAAGWVRASAAELPRAVLLCTAAMLSAAPSQPRADGRWRVLPLDAASAREAARTLGARGGALVEGLPCFAHARRLRARDANALVSRTLRPHSLALSAPPAALLAALRLRGAHGAESAAEAPVAQASAPPAPPRVHVLGGAGEPLRLPARGGFWRARLDGAVAAALPALLGPPGADLGCVGSVAPSRGAGHAGADAAWACVPDARFSVALGASGELTLSAAPARGRAAQQPARAEYSGARSGRCRLWGRPDPDRVLDALEALGIQARAFVDAPTPGARGAGAAEPAEPEPSRIEIRLLGEYAGAGAVLHRDCTEIFVDGRRDGLAPGAAHVALESLRHALTAGGGSLISHRC